MIYIDADACPTSVRDILCRAALKRKFTLTFVANHKLPLPPSPFIVQRQVQQGFDVADNWIAEQCDKGDLVITQDIPLAADALEKGAEAISPRGEAFSPDTIAGRLTMRNFLDTMRASGIQSGGPPALDQAAKQRFANALDRYLARAKKP